MKNILFFLTFLANICFADIGSESFIKSFILSCEQQSKNRDFCSCMANEVLDNLNDKERLLLNASSITANNAQDIQNLQIKVINLSTDEELIKYCLGE
ncbi:hypothetical protein [Campylobacter vicugnae]|uniref:hypothetical protein n=1 Tax=Campylobacter vicugnae TaxID=1660076 RepID=UPI000A343FE5|nr:hypothetical protein [Campylobacter sp. S0112]